MEQQIFNHLSQACYTHCVELAISIRDMDREYYIGPRWGLGSSTSLNNLFVRVLWKPMGALQWVEKGTTEVLSGRKELEFVTKLYFDIQPEDASSIKLRLEFIKGSCGFGVSGGCWASVETDLSKCLASPGSLLLPLALKLGFDDEKFPRYLQDTIQKQFGAPEWVAMADLRSEFVRPQSMERFGMKFCLSFTNAQKNTQLDKYSLELFKMTPTPTKSPYSSCPPFTMLYRQVTSFSTPYFYVNESKLTNGDNERLFQVSATKRKSGRRKGFSIFSLNNLLNNGFPPEEKTMLLELRTADGVQAWPKSGVALRLVQSVYYKTYRDYLRMGLKFVRLYAVDFSESNWDRELHGEVLHEVGTRSMKTPYEEGLELLSSLFDSFSAPDSFFYVFGIPNEPKDFVGLHQLPGFESEEWDDKYSADHYNILMEQYRENVNLVTFTRLEIAGPPPSLAINPGRVSDPSTNYFFPASPIPTPKPRTSSSSSATNYFCFPEKSSPKPKRRTVTRNLLGPLLKDILALVGAQPRLQTLQYFTAFILTDGEFCDVEESSQVLAQLSHHPVSFIFVGIGNGDFSQLRRLLENESYPRLRNNSHMIHFRSFYKWRSALVFYKTRTDAQKVFWKEVTTSVREHCVAYFRMKHPEL